MAADKLGGGRVGLIGTTMETSMLKPCRLIIMTGVADNGLRLLVKGLNDCWSSQRITVETLRHSRAWWQHLHFPLCMNSSRSSVSDEYRSLVQEADEGQKIT